MKPGIYKNLPAAEYHAIQAVSATALKSLSPTPAHGRYKLDNPKESDAFTIGEALHVAVLEPRRWEREWTQSPKFDLRKKQDKADAAMFEDACAVKGMRCLSATDYGNVAEMARKVREHPEAARLLGEATDIELSLIWIDEETGLLCKARIDLLTPRCLVDVKTTKNADDRLFASDAYRLGYHVQYAHYNEGLRHFGMQRREWSTIAIENQPPFEPAVYELDELWQEAGARDRSKRMETMADCLKTGIWPGYSKESIPLLLPAWGMGEDLKLTMDGQAV